MKRVRIIYKGTVASAPLADKSAEMPNAEVLARLLNDVLNAPVPEAAPAESKQEAPKKVSAVLDSKMMELAVDVANLCSKHNAIVDQVSRVMDMDDVDFVPEKAILLARTLVKASHSAGQAGQDRWRCRVWDDHVRPERDFAVYEDVRRLGRPLPGLLRAGARRHGV